MVCGFFGDVERRVLRHCRHFTPTKDDFIFESKRSIDQPVKVPRTSHLSRFDSLFSAEAKQSNWTAVYVLQPRGSYFEYILPPTPVTGIYKPGEAHYNNSSSNCLVLSLGVYQVPGTWYDVPVLQNLVLLSRRDMLHDKPAVLTLDTATYQY